MKKTVFVAMITLGVWSCYSQPSKTEVKSGTEPLKTGTTNTGQSNIFIKDPSQYDKIFIQGLYNYTDPLQLIDNHIISEGYTYWFPEDLQLNRTIVFKASRDKKNFLLSATRTSLTNLSYSFKLTNEKNKIIKSKSGKAVLGSMFFFGSEMDEDSETGEGYSSYEYWDNSGDCWFSLRIGHGNTPNEKQKAKITYGCEDKNKPILELEECPTLRAE